MQETTTELREVRVFVSSTFRDMQEERDELVLRVFPQLRAWCETHGVTWTEIDLRWGVTDEEVRQERVVPICLTEIDNCRPFFIGILGQRYGCPTPLPPAVLDEYPWLIDLPARSLTEIEIMYGALRQPSNATQAFFYFRSPQAEPGGVSVPDSRQEQLKQAIRLSQLPMREPFRSPRELGMWVLEDFSRALAALFPEEVPPTPEDSEPAAQRHLRNRSSRLLVTSESLFAMLDRATARDGPPVLVCSNEGGGKSTLLAAWARRFQDDVSEMGKVEESLGGRIARFFRRRAAPRDSASLCAHVAVGATPFSSRWIGVVRHLADAVGADSEQLKQTHSFSSMLLLLNGALRRVTQHRRIVIAIDGVEQLPGPELDQAVAWAASAAAAKVNVLLTCMPGKLRDFGVTRGWTVIDVPEWDASMRRQFTEKYLSAFSKRLPPHLQAELVTHPQTANPLFLRVVLDELRVFGSHEQLSDRLRRHTAAGNLRELVDGVLERCERDYEDLRSHLVRDALRLLWVARRGLNEAELRDLLGDGRAPLPAAAWSPLYLALRGFIPLRAGLLSLIGTSVRKAVEERYLSERQEKLRAHAQLASWFESRPPSLRRFEELSWHLIATDAAERLATLLTEPATLAVVADSMAEQWRAHARWLETRHNLRVWEKFDMRLFEGQPQAALAAAGLLGDLGWWTAAAKWFSFAGNQIHPDAVELRMRCLAGEAAAQANSGDIENALHCFVELEAAGIRQNQPLTAANAAGNQARLYRRLGRATKAESAIEREASFARQSGDATAIATHHGHRGALYFDNGRAREALVEFDAQLQGARAVSDLSGVREALANSALALDRLSRLDEALRLQTEVETMCTAVRDFAGASNALGQQASILQRVGDLDGALERLERAEELCPEIEDRSARARLLARLGELYADGSVQRYRLALDFVERALALAEEAGDQRLKLELLPRLGWLRTRTRSS